MTSETPENKSDAGAAAKPKKKGKSKLVLTAIGLLVIAGGAYEGYNWWINGRFIETTDDAYVNADITTVLSKVSGYVSEVHMADNTRVKAGDVLIRIEDGDYKLAVRSAQDDLDSAKATVERYTDQIEASVVSVTQSEASLRAAQAQWDEAQITYDRQVTLTKSKVSSQATLDTARTELRSAEAQLDEAKAAVEYAKANVSVLKSQKKEAQQAVQSAQTALEKAERDLKFTVVRAPVDGVVGNRAAQVGSFLQAGSRVAAVVPMDGAYVDANFKETQLDHIRPGAEVTMSIDAYPDHEFTGRVESISPATGSVFSLLPSENATGNFTKVVQRVPVRIKVQDTEKDRFPLRAGMSVIVDLDTRTGRDADTGSNDVALKN